MFKIWKVVRSYWEVCTIGPRHVKIKTIACFMIYRTRLLFITSVFASFNCLRIPITNNLLPYAGERYNRQQDRRRHASYIQRFSTSYILIIRYTVIWKRNHPKVFFVNRCTVSDTKKFFVCQEYHFFRMWYLQRQYWSSFRRHPCHTEHYCRFISSPFPLIFSLATSRLLELPPPKSLFKLVRNQLQISLDLQDVHNFIKFLQ